MTTESTNSSASSDATIELHLSPEELQELSQAGEPSKPALPAQLPLMNAADGRPSRNWQPASTAKMAGASIIYVCVAWVSASQLAGQSRAPTSAPVAPKPPTVIHHETSAENPPSSTVRVVNPFDETEVFEFPVGTTMADSHERVAQILTARARERQSRWERIRPKPSTRTASL